MDEMEEKLSKEEEADEYTASKRGRENGRNDGVEEVIENG